MNNSKLNNNSIINCRLLVLLLAILVFAGCTAQREIVNTDELIKISQPRVFANTFKNGLYKTNIQIHNRDLSGLMFFNKKDSSLRVVMLSEVGLKYFDIEHIIGKENPFVLHQVIDFLNHDKVINSLKNFLDILVIDNDQSYETYKIQNRAGYLEREIKNSGTDKNYIYNSNSGAIEQINQKGKINSTTSLKAYDYLAPGEINYMQGKINFSLVKVEKE